MWGRTVLLPVSSLSLYNKKRPRLSLSRERAGHTHLVNSWARVVILNVSCSSRRHPERSRGISPPQSHMPPRSSRSLDCHAFPCGCPVDPLGMTVPVSAGSDEYALREGVRIPVLCRQRSLSFASKRASPCRSFGMGMRVFFDLFGVLSGRV